MNFLLDSPFILLVFRHAVFPILGKFLYFTEIWRFQVYRTEMQILTKILEFAIFTHHFLHMNPIIHINTRQRHYWDVNETRFCQQLYYVPSDFMFSDTWQTNISKKMYANSRIWKLTEIAHMYGCLIFKTGSTADISKVLQRFSESWMPQHDNTFTMLKNFHNDSLNLRRIHHLFPIQFSYSL